MKLQGARILLTGASSGVGLAATRLLAAEGARLVLVCRRADGLRELLAEEGIEAHVLRVDLAEPGAAAVAVDGAVEHLGGLDVLLSNAASAAFGHTLEVDAEAFDRTVRVSFLATADLVREALPHLRRSRGSIVATGSLMARVPLPTWGAYSASKHALRGFLNSVRIEEREQRSGVEVAMLHPGPIDSPLFMRASSGTDRAPRVPPDAYRPEVVAGALVALVEHPRNEVVLGGQTRVMDLAFSYARPAAEAVLVLIDRWYRSGDEATGGDSLWVAPDAPEARDHTPARDSLLAPLQVGRRVLPDPMTPLRLARHLGRAAVRATRMLPALTRPMPEHR